MLLAENCPTYSEPHDKTEGLDSRFVLIVITYKNSIIVYYICVTGSKVILIHMFSYQTFIEIEINFFLLFFDH